MPRRSLSIALLVLVLAGCAKEKVAPRQGSIDFRVNPERLGAAFANPELGLTLRAPAGWQPLPDSVVTAAMARVGGTPIPRLLAMYQQQPEGAALTVSLYPPAIGGAHLDSVSVVRLAALRAAHPGAQIDDGRFTWHGWEIVQFRTVDAGTVAFQLLLAGSAAPLVQLDYVVPRTVYPRELESIESSIGSLNSSS